jgi:hypothetical protein
MAKQRIPWNSTHVPEQIETEDNFFAHLNFSCIPVYSTTQFLVDGK